MPFEFVNLEIPEVVFVKPRIFADDRGYFLESFKKSDFEKIGIGSEFVQGNISFSKAGVLRGCTIRNIQKFKESLSCV